MGPPPEKLSDLERRKVELALRAYSVMESSLVPVPPHLIPSFRTWHYPPAGPHLSWTVFQHRLDDPVAPPPLVRRVFWDRDGDFERLELQARRRAKAELTLRVTEHELDPEHLQRFVASAAGLPLARSLLGHPCVSEHRGQFGLDGFDIEGWGGRPVVRIEWNAPPPQELGMLAEWSAEVRPWLEESCS